MVLVAKVKIRKVAVVRKGSDGQVVLVLHDCHDEAEQGCFDMVMHAVVQKARSFDDHDPNGGESDLVTLSESQDMLGEVQKSRGKDQQKAAEGHSQPLRTAPVASMSYRSMDVN